VTAQTVLALALLCALTLGLPGCVRYYKTADVRARFSGALTEIDQALRQTEEDVAEMRRLCRPLMPTRPRLRVVLERIEASITALRGYRLEVLKLRTEFERMARRTPNRIPEDRPQWQQLQLLQRRYEAIGDKAVQAVEQYKEQADQLLAAVKQAHGSRQ